MIDPNTITDLPPGQDLYEANEPLIAPKQAIAVSDVPQGPGSGLDSDTIDGLQAVTATAAGPNKLVATDSTGKLPSSVISTGTSSISANGYAHVGSLLIQWGSYTGGSNSPTITYPIAFTTLYAVTGSVLLGSALNGSTLEIISAGNTTFIGNQRRHDSVTLTDNFNWIAVGT